MGKKKKRREKQTMFTYWNFIVSGNGIIATTIPTVDLVSRQGRRDPKKDRKAERTDEEGFIASRSSISLHVHRGPPTLPLSLYEQATETCFSTGRPHLPPSLRIPVAPVLFFSRKDHGTSSLCQVQCHRFSYLALLLFLSLIRYLFPPPQYSRLNFILLRFLRIYFSTSSSV